MNCENRLVNTFGNHDSTTILFVVMVRWNELGNILSIIQNHGMMIDFTIEIIALEKKMMSYCKIFMR